MNRQAQPKKEQLVKAKIKYAVIGCGSADLTFLISIAYFSNWLLRKAYSN